MVIQVLVLCAICGGYLYFNQPAPETPAEAEQRRQTEAARVAAYDLNPPVPPVPETEQRRQTEARVAAYNENVAKQEAVRSAYKDQLCRALPICIAYKSARNDCGIAANFNNCVRIKIGNIDFDKLMYCNEDGTLAAAELGPNLSAPGALECWLRNNTALYK